MRRSFQLRGVVSQRPPRCTAARGRARCKGRARRSGPAKGAHAARAACGGAKAASAPTAVSIGHCAMRRISSSGRSGGQENAPEAEPLCDGRALRRIEAEMRVGKSGISGRSERRMRKRPRSRTMIASTPRAARAGAKARGFVQLVLADGDVEREIRAAAADAAVATGLKFAVRNVLRPAATSQILKSSDIRRSRRFCNGGDGLRRPAGASSSTIISSS